MAKEQKKKARFINPPNKLRQKVGTGGIDETLLAKSQQYIETNTEVDFTPVAKDFLQKLAGVIKDIKSGKISGKDAISAMINPVMQLKANGGMFRYQLLSDVADIALQFLERIDELNTDGFELIDAHEKTIHVIIANGLRGDGGAEGYKLVKELDQARIRYFDKHGAKDAPPKKKPAKKPAKKAKK
jgi:hypothetical protein